MCPSNILTLCPLQIWQRWVFGPFLCDMWTCGDVLCCTASILHLLAIALDRSEEINFVYFEDQININKTHLYVLSSARQSKIASSGITINL